MVIERLRATPAVTDAAVALGLPLAGNPRAPYSVGGRPDPAAAAHAPLAGFAIVSENYFRLMRIGLVEGRAFQAGDRDGAPFVCIVNESLARHVFPGESALGKTLLRGRDAEVEERDRRRDSRRQDERAERAGAGRDLLSGASAADEPGMNVIARTDGDPAALQAIIRAAVAAVDKDQPISFFATLETNVATSLGAQRIVASLTDDLRGAGVRDVGGGALFSAGVRGVAADRGNRDPDGAGGAVGTGDPPDHAQRPGAGGDRTGAGSRRRGRRRATSSRRCCSTSVRSSPGLRRRRGHLRARGCAGLPAAVSCARRGSIRSSR